MTIKFPIKRRITVLALGAESAGVFAVYRNGGIFVSENFGDLLDESNFLKYKKAVLAHLREEKIKPDVILTDLHPLFKTTAFGEELARKYRTPHIKVQHHIAHIFSAVGDKIINIDKAQSYSCRHSERSISGVKNLSQMRDTAHSCEILRFAQNDKLIFPNTFFGLAMDGTGYGLDGNIWGGEVFRIKILNPKIQIPNKSQNPNSKIQAIRIGSLEEQTMIGGDATVKEPARMIIAILAKISNLKSQISNKSQLTNLKIWKDFIYKFVKKFYTRNEFELLYNQMKQNFNCQKTTSTGRILDAVSVLLGFAGNERKYKHEATKLLEKNSTIPYDDIKLKITNYESRKILNTTYLFEYLLKNIHKDKKRLAATAQKYIAKGFCEIIKKNLDSKFMIHDSCFAAGGMTNNKIVSKYLEKNSIYSSKKIPRGDEGIAVGQIVYYLLNKI